LGLGDIERTIVTPGGASNGDTLYTIERETMGARFIRRKTNLREHWDDIDRQPKPMLNL